MAALPDYTPQGAPHTVGFGEFLTNLTSNGTGIFVLVAGIIATFLAFYYGFMYATSAGDPTKSKNAKQGLINVLIGVIALSLTYGLIRLGIVVGEFIRGSA